MRIYIYVCVCMHVCLCARFSVVNWSVLSFSMCFSAWPWGPGAQKVPCFHTASESKVLIFRGLWVPQAGDVLVDKKKQLDDL